MTVGELKKELEKFDDNLLVLHDETDWGICELGYPTLENINNEHLSKGSYLSHGDIENLRKASINDFVLIDLISVDDPQRRIE